MTINPAIFRAYDIRGVFPKDIDGKVAELIGKAFGTWLVRNRSKRDQNLSVVVGRDNRFSSDELTAKLVEGLLSTGCDVIDIGLAITPLVHFATIKYDVIAGVMVTASHNPKEFNGFRFDLKNAEPFYGQQIQSLVQVIKEDDYEKGIGKISYKEDVFKDYSKDLTGRIKIDKPFKIVVDCGNGAASKFATDLFLGLGIEVVGLFCNLDGDFPYHQPDPEERINLQTLRLKVVEEKADLGVGFDTDADRFGLVDEKGTPYENDKILILLARDVLKNRPGSKIIFDVKSSYVLEQEIRKLGGTPLYMRTGHPFFRKYMENNKDVFLGGELSSHTFIRDDYYGYDDGIYAAARVAQIISNSGNKMSEHFFGIPHTAHTEEIKISCSDEKKLDIVRAIGLRFFNEGYQIGDIDGYRINLDTNSWFLIRASNTSPYISLRFEAENKEGLLSAVSLVKERLSQFPELDLIGLGPKLSEKSHNI